MTTLVLIRHGESNVTVQRVIGGLRTCTGLSALGIAQAERLRDRVARTGELAADVLVASTMPRAVQTAQIVAGALAGAEVVADPELCEHDPGECDGLAFTEYVDRYGTPDWTDLDAEVFPGGETIRQFHTRVVGAIDRLVAEHADRRLVVVCHGGVIDAALRHLLATPMTGGFDLFTVNASITELRYRPSRWRLIRYNDAAHLEDLPTETPPVGPGAA